MRFNEFKTEEGIEKFMSVILGSPSASSTVNDIVDKVASTATSTDKPTDKPNVSPSTGTVSNGYAPKGATPEQMKQFGPSSQNKIDWREMRSYIASKLSFNHAVAMVVNCKW